MEENYEVMVPVETEDTEYEDSYEPSTSRAKDIGYAVGGGLFTLLVIGAVKGVTHLCKKAKARKAAEVVEPVNTETTSDAPVNDEK